jgi:stage V sporulation protein D (sporulation-specific penicillin-binding protein)
MKRSVAGPVDPVSASAPLPESGIEGEKARDSIPESASGASSQSPALGIRALLLLVAFLIVSLVVVVRLLAWQVPGSKATGPEPATPPDKSARGRIVDSNGLLLATDSFVWEVYVRPTALRASPHGTELIAELASILGMSEDALNTQLAQDSSLVILDKLSDDAACQQIGKLGHTDLAWCTIRRKREYPMGAIGAPVIGFANLDQQGVAGSEWYYDAWLRATDEWPDNRLPPGQPEPLPESWKVYLPSPGGRDLVLHLNAALQHLTEQRLQEAVQYYGAESGTIIVMDPRTGGILALANVPSFDPNRYAQSPAELWGNSAVRDTYEPGSVFKLVTYAAAIDSGKVTPETMFEDSGSLAIAGQTIQNAEEQAYGSVTAREALAKSINVVAAQICLDMGAEVFYRYVRQFGFGKPTEVDLNYESEGIVKGLGNKYWSQYDQAANSFGQGISVTALQMLNAVAAIANGGEVLQPQAVRALVLNGQVYEIPPRVMRRAITAETARTMAQLMVYNVESSSNPSPVPGFRVAGKTGTAEIPTETGYTSDETITSFAAFLPAADPKLVVLVKLVKPTRSSWAERVVVPVFAQVAQDAIQVLGIQPDDRNP